LKRFIPCLAFLVLFSGACTAGNSGATSASTTESRVAAQNNAVTSVPSHASFTFTVSAGAAAPASICQGDPACRWWNFNEHNIRVGTYTLRCFDKVGGNYGVSYTIHITSTHWSFNGSGSRGYCANAYHGRIVWATLSGPKRTYRSASYVWP
jgi:hypothetical protein